METKINEEEAKNALNEKERQAEKLLGDKEQTHKTLKKANKLLDKIKKIPVIGKIADDIATSIELIRDFIDGKYRHVPTKIIVSALACLLYIINPFDLIPDYIPFVGWLDDSFVFTLILTAGLSLELNKYRKWKKTQEGEPVNKKGLSESIEKKSDQSPTEKQPPDEAEVEKCREIINALFKKQREELCRVFMEESANNPQFIFPDDRFLTEKAFECLSQMIENGDWCPEDINPYTKKIVRDIFGKLSINDFLIDL